MNKQGMGKISVREKEKKTFGSYQGTPKKTFSLCHMQSHPKPWIGRPDTPILKSGFCFPS